jgi:hypothetical protein
MPLRRLTHADPLLATSGRYLRIGRAASQPHLLCLLSPSRDQVPSGTSCSALRRVVNPTRMASADFCRLIPPPHDRGSTRQSDRSPRVRRATFAPHTRRIYLHIVRMVMVMGFESLGPLARMCLPHAVPVRRAGALPAASFRFRLATDTLAVRLTVPTIRVRKGLSPSSRPARHHSEPDRARSWRCAPCLAHP